MDHMAYALAQRVWNQFCRQSEEVLAQTEPKLTFFPRTMDLPRLVKRMLKLQHWLYQKQSSLLYLLLLQAHKLLLSHSRHFQLLRMLKAQQKQKNAKPSRTVKIMFMML